MRSKVVRGLVLAFVGFALSACGLFDKAPSFPCPKVFVLGDAGNLVRFKPGPGRDITDIVFEARIADFTGSCEYDEKKMGVDIELLVQIELRRGPAGGDGAVSFEYFIALPDFRPSPDGKRIMPVTGKFERNLTRMMYRDEVNMFIPLADLQDGPETEIVIGFQLVPEEIEFNRLMQQR